MKLFILYILLLFFTQSTDWDIKTLDTGRKATYLSDIEKDVILELNKVRTNPQKYAKEYLEPLKKFYSGLYFEFPGEKGVKTREGIAALEECIEALNNEKPVGILYPYYGLSEAADYLQIDQYITGNTGHFSSDGKSLSERIEKYGKWDGTIGENIDYGSENARKVIISLLIDDGVPSRGHRKNIFNSSFQCVGVSFGKHGKYEYSCVIDFAAKFIDYVK